MGLLNVKTQPQTMNDAIPSLKPLDLEQPRPEGLAAVPLFGFRAAWAAVWSQSQKIDFALRNLASISVKIYAGGVELIGLLRRDEMSRWLEQHKPHGDEWRVETPIGVLFVKRIGYGDSTAEVRLQLDLERDVTDEGWIKGFDRACDAIWRKPNDKILPPAEGGATKVKDDEKR